MSAAVDVGRQVITRQMKMVAGLTQDIKREAVNHSFQSAAESVEEVLSSLLYNILQRGLQFLGLTQEWFRELPLLMCSPRQVTYIYPIIWPICGIFYFSGIGTDGRDQRHI